SALAAPRFTHQSDAFTAEQVKGDIIERAEFSLLEVAADVEIFREPTHLDDGLSDSLSYRIVGGSESFFAHRGNFPGKSETRGCSACMVSLSKHAERWFGPTWMSRGRILSQRGRRSLQRG